MKTTKRDLLDAAIELFADQGYEGTSIGQIEAAVGLKPRAGGFYRHFSSKEALLMTIVETRFDASLESRLTGVLELGDTRSQLLLIAQAYREVTQESWQVIRIVTNESTRMPKLKNRMRKTNIRILKSLRAWIATKPFADPINIQKQNELILNVLGGWLFYLNRKSIDEKFIDMNETRFLNSWAELWAGILDTSR